MSMRGKSRPKWAYFRRLNEKNEKNSEYLARSRMDVGNIAYTVWPNPSAATLYADVENTMAAPSD